MTPTTTTDAIPTTAQVWHALRALFGSQLLDASVVVLTSGGNPDAHDVTFTTYVLPAHPQQRKQRNKMHACDDQLCAVCGSGIGEAP